MKEYAKALVTSCRFILALRCVALCGWILPQSGMNTVVHIMALSHIRLMSK